jgi:hypothetical protein
MIVVAVLASWTGAVEVEAVVVDGDVEDVVVVVEEPFVYY